MTIVQTSNPLPYAQTIRSLIRAHRELKFALPWVVKNSRLTVEEADLLLCLYEVYQPGREALARDGDGFVACHELAGVLVHHPSLLSRRLIKLAKSCPPLLEVAKGNAATRRHGNSKRVRLTSAGVKEIAGVWQRYQAMAASMLQGIPEPDRVAHDQINREIRRRIRAGRAGLEMFLAGQLAPVVQPPAPAPAAGAAPQGLAGFVQPAAMV